MLRREFFGAAASATLVPQGMMSGCRLDALVSELRSVLASDMSVDHFDLVYEPGSSMPLIVAAYGKNKVA